MEAICLICRKPFEKNAHNQKVCGKECRRKYTRILVKNWKARHKVIQMCLVCDKPVLEKFQKRYHKKCAVIRYGARVSG